MKALLAHLVRGQRRPGVALAIAGGALAAAAALMLGSSTRSPGASLATSRRRTPT